MTNNLDQINLSIQYEDLRSEALQYSVNCNSKNHGLALFIRNGMLAWIQAWSSCTLPHISTSEQKTHAPKQSFSSDLNDQVAILLTNMALNIFKEVKTIS